MKPSGKSDPAYKSHAERAAASRAFTAGADNYDIVRPSYPAEIAELVPPHSTVLDVGAGTGKFTQLLAEPSAQRTVLAVDPSEEMVRTLRANLPQVPAWRATAERTGMFNASVDAVTCAQTWHWVNPEEALREADRIIRSDGRLVLVWNTLDVTHPWVLRLSRISHSGDVHREGFYPDIAPPWVLTNERHIKWMQMVTTDDLFRLARSRSYWLRATEEIRAKVEANLSWYLFERLGFEPGDCIPLPYRTDAFCYRRDRSACCM